MEPLPKKQRIAINRILKKDVDKTAKILGADVFLPNETVERGELELTIGFAKGVNERGLYERCSNALAPIGKALGKESDGAVKHVTLLADVPPERNAIIERSIKERLRGKARVVTADANFSFTTEEPSSITVYVMFDKGCSEKVIEKVWPELTDAAIGSIGGEMYRIFSIIELTAELSDKFWVDRLRDSEEGLEYTGRPD